MNKSEFSISDLKYFMDRWDEILTQVKDEKYHRINDNENENGDIFLREISDNALDMLIDEMKKYKTK